jgi:hypothetical protein
MAHSWVDKKWLPLGKRRLYVKRVGKMCVATMIVLIVTGKRRDGRYYFAL